MQFGVTKFPDSAEAIGLNTLPEPLYSLVAAATATLAAKWPESLSWMTTIKREQRCANCWSGIPSKFAVRPKMAKKPSKELSS